MQIYSQRLVRVGVLVFVTIALALSAQAAGFSNASLKGSYSFLVNKWTADVDTNELAVVGVMTFDGAGNVTALGTEIKGGVIQTGTLGGAYTVNSNGTGAINFTTGENPPRYAITLNSTAAKLAHGVQLLVIDDNDNEVISGTALLQSTTAATYGETSLKGNFSFQFNKWTANVNSNQEGYIGILSFDGKGNVKGSFTDMNGGVLQTWTVTGTYTVDSDGSGSASFTCGHSNCQIAFALNSVAAGQAKGFQFLVTEGESNGNGVMAGTALKQ